MFSSRGLEILCMTTNPRAVQFDLSPSCILLYPSVIFPMNIPMISTRVDPLPIPSIHHYPDGLRAPNSWHSSCHVIQKSKCLENLIELDSVCRKRQCYHDKQNWMLFKLLDRASDIVPTFWEVFLSQNFCRTSVEASSLAKTLTSDFMATRLKFKRVELFLRLASSATVDAVSINIILSETISLLICGLRFWDQIRRKSATLLISENRQRALFICCILRHSPGVGCLAKRF